MSTTSAITTYTGQPSSTNAAGTSSATGDSVNENQFLNLLVTQLQYQDPTQPMDDSQFVSELAQFSSLQESTNLNTTMSGFTNTSSLQTAASMIGATVTTSATDSNGDAIGGQVSSASNANGTINVVVGSNTVPLSDVTSVTYPTTSSSSTGSTGS
jgi:flagellar basal-body rod modification protein FlgD